MGSFLITGANGFAGTALRQILKDSHEHHVHEKSESCPDITDAAAVDLWIGSCMAHDRLDYVIHLAGQPSIPVSFANPEQTFKVNFSGTENLLNSLKREKFSGKFVYVSSADVYGGGVALPITESQPTRPKNPYSLSKSCAELLCSQWVDCGWMDAVIARPFNHIGPGQSDQFSISSFCKKSVQRMRDADASPLVFGNLNTTRDFLDVRDVANAYISLATCGKSGEVYNICSGTERSMCDALLTVFNLAGAPLGDDFATDKDGGRQNDTERMLGSNNKLRSTTGWVQKYNFEESIRDTIDYWRGIIHD